MLKEAQEEEKQKWLSKQGTDWSGAFGDDPAAYMDKNGKKKSRRARVHAKRAAQRRESGSGSVVVGGELG